MLRCITACLLLVLLAGCERGGESPAHVTVLVSGVRQGEPARSPDFNRDVRPILSDHCFRCHGPDAAARKRGLRLDTPDGATALLRSGKRAIVPDDFDASEAARRIMSEDPDEMMPPPEMKHPLTDAQKRVLLDWMRSGATYQAHWAFVPPLAVTLPTVKGQAWCCDAIDRFVLARLESPLQSHLPWFK